MKYRIATLLIALVVPLAGCGSDSDSITTVEATVAEHAYEGDGLTAGSALAGAELRLYVGDTVVFETTLDESGLAEVEIEAGVYTVQVDLPATGDCFWGETLFNVAFPTDRVELNAFYICPG